MMEFIREAGWPIFPVLTVGVASLAAALRYSQGRKDLLHLVVGLGATTLILGLLGTVLGIQMSARHIGEIPEKWIFLLGLKESLNNLVVALVICAVDALLVTLKGMPRAYVRTPDPAPAPRV